MTNENLPALPQYDHVAGGWGGSKTYVVYTADQMREYGAECWRLGRIHGQGDTTQMPECVVTDGVFAITGLPESKP